MNEPLPEVGRRWLIDKASFSMDLSLCYTVVGKGASSVVCFLKVDTFRHALTILVIKNSWKIGVV